MENIAGMLKGFETLGLALGVVAASVFAVKEAFDLSLEGEKIERITDQFNLLSQSAGISAEQLKTSLESNSHGLIAQTDLLAAASKGIVELGKNSMIMGQTMEIAMKISKVSGQDALEVFSGLNNAVAAGNVRMLRQYGIIVDNQKALVSYAQSHGKFVSDLTEEEKRQAVATQALMKARDAYKNINVESVSLTEETKKLNVQWTEFKDSVALAVEKIFKPVFMPIVSAMTTAIHELGIGINQTFGSDAVKNAAGIEVLKGKIADLTSNIEAAKQHEGFWNKILSEETLQKKIASMEGFKEQYIARLNELEKKSEEFKEKESAPAAGKGGGEDKRAAQVKFEQDLLKLTQERVDAEMKVETDFEAYKSELIEKRGIMEMELYNKLREVDENAKKEGIVGTEMVENQKYEIKKKYALQIEQLDKDMAAQEIAVLQHAADVDKKNAAGFAAGWKLSSKQAANDFMNFSTLGQKANAGLTKSLSAGFKAIGDGSQNAADAMKKAFLGQIGDEAEARGEYLLAASLWPPQPLGLLAGGALVALGSKLKSLAGGGGSSIGASSGGGGGGTASDIASQAVPDTASTLAQAQDAQKQRAVTIQVQGNYFETEQTKRTLMEMIRQETDATSFSYVQINQGGAS